MRRTAAKALTGMLCATLALVGGLVLTGCSGADPEEAVRADLTANFDQLKNLEGDALEEIADALTADLMEAVTSGALDPNDDDAINAWAGEYMMGLVEQIEPSEKTISLTYVNGDDGWTMDDSSASEVAQIFV